MAPQPQASLEAWSKLELASPARRVDSVKSQARVLATTDSGAEPLLVMDDIDPRRAAILVLEDTSRWMTSEKKTKATVDLHRRFWKQLLSHLARFEEPKDRVHLERAGDVIHVSAKFGNNGVARADNLVAHAWLIRPDGQEVRFQLVATLKAIGDFEARVPISAPGEYRIVVRVESQGRLIGDEDARIIVPKEDAEFRRTSPDHLMLGEIAYATGGGAYRPGQLTRFLTQVESQLPPPQTRTKEHIEAFVCSILHDGTPDDFAIGLAALLQSQSISSRIIRRKDPADRALVEVPLDDGRSLRIDPVTGQEAGSL
jgi:hypothetical protein